MYDLIAVKKLMSYQNFLRLLKFTDLVLKGLPTKCSHHRLLVTHTVISRLTFIDNVQANIRDSLNIIRLVLFFFFLHYWLFFYPKLRTHQIKLSEIDLIWNFNF